MSTLAQAKAEGLPNTYQGKVAATTPKGAKAECIFADGTSVLVSNFLRSFIRPHDEIIFPLGLGPVEGGTQIYIRASNAEHGRQDLLQVEIGYVSQPRKDKRDNLFVSAEVRNPLLGVSAILLQCETLRDYFYVGNRRRAWDRQPSFYALLQVNPKVSPAELRLGFRLRALELRTAHASTTDLSAAERAFNMLANPELRACYDSLLNDSASPALFPHGGFASLLVAGEVSRDGRTFFASRILSFVPQQKFKYIRAPLRNVTFHDHFAIYRDSRRRLEVFFDPASLPLAWDSSWNQWKHLLGAKIGIKATFVQSGKYQRRAGGWDLTKWETAMPSRLETTLPAKIDEYIADARRIYHRFGQFAKVLDPVRTRIESAPVEKTELQKLCIASGVPSDFDIALISWRPDYDAFYYKQLSKRARRIYLFRSEYIFDLEQAVIVETPQAGHATYLFSKSASIADFLATYTSVTHEQILKNRTNVAEKLGFMGRLIHGFNPKDWLKELKLRLGETVDYAAEMNDYRRKYY